MVTAAAAAASEKRLASEVEAAKTVVQVLKKRSFGTATTKALLEALCDLGENKAASDAARTEGGIGAVVAAMQRYDSSEAVQLRCCVAIWSLAYRSEQQAGWQLVRGAGGLRALARAKANYGATYGGINEYVDLCLVEALRDTDGGGLVQELAQADGPAAAAAAAAAANAAGKAASSLPQGASAGRAGRI